jgi:2-phosphosulfolactate phosphatase
MGNKTIIRTDEDELCALHLRNLLEGRTGNAEAVRQVILAGGDALRFHDPSRPYLDRSDLEIALDVDRFDFAIRVTLDDGRPVGRIERVA